MVPYPFGEGYSTYSSTMRASSFGPYCASRNFGVSCSSCMTAVTPPTANRAA